MKSNLCNRCGNEYWDGEGLDGKCRPCTDYCFGGHE